MTQENEKTIGQKLREAREAAPLKGEERAKSNRRHPYPTQNEIADRIGMDRSQYTNCENDNAKLPEAAAIKLEREFKKPAGYFRSEKTPPGVARRFARVEARVARLEEMFDELSDNSPASSPTEPISRRGRRAGSQR